MWAELQSHAWMAHNTFIELWCKRRFYNSTFNTRPPAPPPRDHGNHLNCLWMGIKGSRSAASVKLNSAAEHVLRGCVGVFITHYITRWNIMYSCAYRCVCVCVWGSITTDLMFVYIHFMCLWIWSSRRCVMKLIPIYSRSTAVRLSSYNTHSLWTEVKRCIRGCVCIGPCDSVSLTLKWSGGTLYC